MALEIGQDFQQTVGNPTKCDDNIKYWLPIKLDRYSEGHYHWSGDQYFDSSYNVKNINWTTSQPNSYGNEKCAGVTQISGKYFELILYNGKYTVESFMSQLSCNFSSSDKSS